MATVASPPHPSAQPRPPSVTGPCRLTLRIGGTRSTPSGPSGISPAFGSSGSSRRSIPTAPLCTTRLPSRRESPSVAPAQTTNSVVPYVSISWHLRLWASSPRPKPHGPSKAHTRQLHARNARQAIAEAKALPVEAPRHLAEIATSLPEGWVPSSTHPSFAAGFQQAVAAHVRPAPRHARPGSVVPHLRPVAVQSSSPPRRTTIASLACGKGVLCEQHRTSRLR